MKTEEIALTVIDDSHVFEIVNSATHAKVRADAHLIDQNVATIRELESILMQVDQPYYGSYLTT